MPLCLWCLVRVASSRRTPQAKLNPLRQGVAVGAEQGLCPWRDADERVADVWRGMREWRRSVPELDDKNKKEVRKETAAVVVAAVSAAGACRREQGHCF